MKKKILSLMLSISMLLALTPNITFAYNENASLAAVQVFDGGTGTEEDPFLISTEDQLRLIADLPTCSFKLTENIELQESWSPIGTAGDSFSGTLDGDWHTVSGLTDTFLKTNDGTVKNISLQCIDNYIDASALMADMNNGLLEDCSIKGKTEYSESRYCSGFVYKNYGIINSCYFNGVVSSSAYTLVGGYGQVAQHCDTGTPSSFVYENYGNIRNSYARGTLIGGHKDWGGPVSGFAYKNTSDGAIHNCYCSVIMKNGSSQYGFHYSNSGTIINSYFDKDVSGITNGGTPKASLALKMQATFTDWDFDTVWDIDENINDGYAYLQMEQNFLPKVESIAWEKKNVYLQTGSTVTLNPEIIPADTGRKKVWSSSDESIATVSSAGEVTALAAGDVQITLLMGDFSRSCNVHVVDNLVLVNGATLDKEELTLECGGGYQLTAALGPANATDKNVSWKSSDESVATVSSDGTVTAVANGTATITVTTSDGGYTDSCAVTVITSVTGITLDNSTVNMYKGKVFTLSATVEPPTATNKNVIWKSSNEDIASVADGIVTAKGVGTVTITATTEDGGKHAQCNITITIPVDGVSLNKNETTIKVGESEQLIANITPINATDTTVIWESSDNSVATVENGFVTAIKPGTTVITVTTNDGGKKAECYVTVPVSVTGITINKESVTIKRGDYVAITATVLPSNATNKVVYWESDNEAVASVEDGIITANSAGNAIITAKTADGGITAQCNVTVYVAVEGVTLNKANTTIKIGNSEKLIATISPYDVTDNGVSWHSSNENVATVEDGVVTAKSSGKTTITVKTNDSGKTAQCVVLVPVSVTGIELNKDNVSIDIGDTTTIKATVLPTNATNKNVIWRSSNENIVTVKDGVITAISEGNAVITAITEDEGKSAECNVTVTVPIGSITLNKSSISLEIGKTDKLFATISPSNTTDKSIVWSSTNEDIATVENGVVTAVNVGTAVISATSADGSKKAECVVNVIILPDGITLDISEAKINVGETQTINATVTPSNATDKSVVWYSSNESVATVDGGIVTGVSEGTATITAKTTQGDYIASCKVTVVVPVEAIELDTNNVELKENESTAITATILPANATDKSIQWVSSNTNVATVEDGLITAVNPGSSIITAFSANGVSATCIVNVDVKYNATIKVGKDIECAGEMVTVPVYIEDNPGMATFNLTFEFDDSKLEIVEIENGEILTEGTLTSNLHQEEFAGNVVTAYWSNTDNVIDDGEILKLTFRIKEDVSDGETPIKATYTLGDILNQDYENIALNIKDGIVEITSILKGDVKEDGVVDGNDGLRLNQYLADWDISLTKFEERAADVYADEEINAKDGLKLGQYLAKWDVSLMAVSLLEEKTIVFDVDNVSSPAGNYVDVPVYITENSGVATFKVKLNYDTEKLVPVAITKNLIDGTLASNLQQEEFSDDYISVYWINPSNVMEVGKAFTVRFKVAEDITGEIPVSISYEENDICDQKYNDLAVTLENGAVVITDNATLNYVYTVSNICVGENVSVDVIKNVERNEIDTLFIAVYASNGALIDVVSSDISNQVNETVTITKDLTIEEGCKVKAFVFDGLGDIQSLSNVEVLDVK